MSRKRFSSRPFRRAQVAALFAAALAGRLSAEDAAVVPPNIAPPPPASATQAATAPATQSAASQPAQTQPTILKKVLVSGELTREVIAPALGAVEYTIGPQQIQNIPGGENAPLQQLLLRAPGVVLDSFGQEHVRGEHANLTYRVNGVLLPEPLIGFGQELDTHLIQSLTLIDGSLPAEFGFHTAGIIDVTTKSGAALKSNTLSLYGGSNDTIQPAFQLGGSDGRFDWFVSGSFNHNDLGVENTTPAHRALHDYTNQEKFFGYFGYQLDDTSRISLFIGAASATFEIPATPGVPPAFDLAGFTGTPDSRQVDENQHEQNYYTVLAYQKSIGDLNLQIAAFSRYADIEFHPGFTRDLIFQGVAGKVSNDAVANGIQFDASYPINDQHTLRAGFLATYTCEQLRTNTTVFRTDDNGDQSSDVPFAIQDNTRNGGLEAGVYLQDEFKVTEKLTLNYGIRYDTFDSNFDHEGQLSPRLNLVFKADDKTTFHAGYSRFFVPPPVKQLRFGSVAKFVGTTNSPDTSPETFAASPPKVERSNYYDIGVSRQLDKHWNLTLDAYYKQAKNLIDEGQFGAPLILSAFNYRRGYDYGAELGTTYKNGGLSLFGNFAWNIARGRGINSQQFLFEKDEFDYSQSHDVTLDHVAMLTASAGAAYAWKNDSVYIDFLYGSGLRNGFANTGEEPSYYPVNVGYQHIFHMEGNNSVTFRFDIVNLFDENYQIHDGSGIGTGATQFGARRAFYAGLAYNF